MLWYKAWLETRTRFLIGVLTLGWVCTMIVVFHRQGRLGHTSMTYEAYIWNAIYKDYVRNLFIVLTILLGGGTLLQETALGTAGFTLALPVGRQRLVLVRAGVGIAELIALAFVPAFSVPVLSKLIGQEYGVVHASSFATLWACGGIAIFGFAQFVATRIGGTASAWITTFLALWLYTAAVNVTQLSRVPGLDLFKMMSGPGPLPWLSLAVVVLCGLGFLWAAVRGVEARDFA